MGHRALTEKYRIYAQSPSKLDYVQFSNHEHCRYKSIDYALNDAPAAQVKINIRNGKTYHGYRIDTGFIIQAMTTKMHRDNYGNTRNTTLKPINLREFTNVPFLENNLCIICNFTIGL